MAARRGPALLLVLAYASAKSSEFNRPVDLEALEASYDEADSEDWHEDSQRWRDARTEAANARSLKAQVDAKLAEARGEAPPAEPRAAGRTTVQTWWQAAIARGSVEMASVRVHDIKPTVFRVWFMGEDADDGLRAWVLAQPGSSCSTASPLAATRRASTRRARRAARGISDDLDDGHRNELYEKIYARARRTRTRGGPGGRRGGAAAEAPAHGL
ncbi:hypothetical protein SO694_00006447 [Aureococcus anophagefferens]|uniref:Uncharacterized protein n=1 Tax=Aureococcus anophagefferens TaxID=44056 RepID=A0ABR1GAC4_AURAN